MNDLIGGSGLDDAAVQTLRTSPSSKNPQELGDPQILEGGHEVEVVTKYGKPASPLTVGKIGGVDVVILARHGRKHEFSPTQVPNRANIQALKDQGCTHIIATTACGSLREEIDRGDFVVLDQFIDFTKKRMNTFCDSFENGAVHAAMADPFDENLREILFDSCVEQGLNVHGKGTVVTIEGPRFSTRAESNMFRLWGADVINMSTAPEAALANEAGIAYAAVAMSTDYDCWKIDEEAVSWEEVLKVFEQNAESVKRLLISAIPKVKDLSGDSIKSKIRTIPNFPKPGIMFRDITTLLNDKEGLKEVVKGFVDRYRDMEIDKVAAIESRGFVLGGVLAQELDAGLVLLRKPGKLPGMTESEEYSLEYGTDKLEIHVDAIKEGDNVLICDDLIATGGTALAACKLVKRLGGRIVECGFIIDLPDLGGKKKLEENGFGVFNLVSFEGE